MNKKHCRGCADNFYNGNNPLGVDECFHFKTAKIVWRIPVGLFERPPYNNKKKVRVPNCYHGRGNNRIIYVNPNVLTKEGYWK